jgi:hypothetical protein
MLPSFALTRGLEYTERPRKPLLLRHFLKLNILTNIGEARNTRFDLTNGPFVDRNRLF